MHRVRSVSGHVSLARCLPLPPLRSTRITRLLRYYERLRLPGPLRPLPRCLSLSEAARSRTPTPGSPWLLLAPRQARCGFSSRGRLHRLANSPGHLLPASILKLSAFPNAVISGLSTFTVGFTRYHCASLTFVPTHQVPHYWNTCKARYQTRG